MLNKMLEWIKKNKDIFLLGCIFLLLHLCMNTDYWDDHTNRTIIQSADFSWTAYWYDRWTTASSRVVLDTVQLVFFWLPDVIWRILDFLFAIRLYSNIVGNAEGLTGKKMMEKERIIAACLYLSIPFCLYATAGWISTSINYLWVLCAFSEAMRILIRSGKERIGAIEYIIYGSTLFYFSNFNVTAMVTLILLTIVFLLYRKNEMGEASKILIYIGWAVALINILLVAICPGNRTRNELDARFHDAADLMKLGLFGKIRMGINTCFYHFVSIPNGLLFLSLLLIALLIICDKRQSRINKSIALVPILLDVGCTIYMFVHYMLNGHALSYVYPDGGFETSGKVEQYMIMICAIMIVLGVVISIRCILDDTKLFWICMLMLFVFGLMPQVALGFTTTVSASGIRMSLYVYLAFAVIDLILIAAKGTLMFGKRLYTTLTCIAVCAAAVSLLQTVRHIMIYG